MIGYSYKRYSINFSNMSCFNPL